MGNEMDALIMAFLNKYAALEGAPAAPVESYDELYKLEDMLTKAGIPNAVRELNGGLQCMVYFDQNCTRLLDDCVLTPTSHGHSEGLLETYILRNCRGYETAEEVYLGWKKVFDRGSWD